MWTLKSTGRPRSTCDYDSNRVYQALAYVTHKAPYVYPIVGGRKVEHLKGNIEALALKLTTEEIDEIEDALDFDVGFPMNMLFGLHDPSFKYKSRLTTADITILKNNAWLESPEKLKPIEAKNWEEKEPKIE